MYLVLLTYVRPLSDVDALMKDHVAFLKRCYQGKVFVASGRRVPRTGGVILARAPDEATLRTIMDLDPFVANGVATYELVRFNTSMFDPAFAPFADPKDPSP
jgi:uncharacterized protein YciI